MDRLPFNPAEATGAPNTSDAAPARREARQYAHMGEKDQLTVSEVTALIRRTLERIPSPLRVIGEVSNLNTPGHWYFSLKDESSVLSCVAWASSARKFTFKPGDGDEVVATGHISHYGPQGRTQLYVTNLKPVGAGALEIRFQQMCRELRALGYFEEDRKKALPLFPRRIAVITSASGAAVQDVISTAAQRCPAVGLRIVDVRVQGEGAAEQIARAIQRVDANATRLGVDAILVTRGGGSMEDLWAFNERVVADAVYACRLPIVAAIGHESDTTVIELVADVRAATPTQAAMRLVPSALDMLQQVSHLRERLHLLTRRRVDRERHRLESLLRHEAFRTPHVLIRRASDRIHALARELKHIARSRLAREAMRVERLAGRWTALQPVRLLSARRERLAIATNRLRAATMHRLERGHQRISALDREIQAIDPREVLKRGFSFTLAADGSLVRSAGQVASGEAVTTRLIDGSFKSVVVGKPARRRRTASTESAESAEPGSQMDLFGPSQ